MADDLKDQVDILEGLQRLSKALAELDDKHSPKKLSHFGADIPSEVSNAYDTMYHGSTLIHGTSTKYTLMGKISPKEQSKIAHDLLKGCQLVAAGSMVICDDLKDGNENNGCSRSARYYVKRSSRAIIASTIALIDSFVSDVVDGGSHVHAGIGSAPRCGAVWEATNTIIEKKLPIGNRNAMRRDLFTWMAECKETIDEFHEIVDQGPFLAEDGEAQEEEAFEDFFGQEQEQYTAKELPIAEACIALMKCSRGCVNTTLKACEAAKDQVTSDTQRKESILEWISTLHDLTRAVGEGVTDLGTVLYPTLDLDEVQEQAIHQTKSIAALQDFILDSGTVVDLPEEITGLAGRVKANAETKCEEASKAIQAAKS